jgi:phosphate transport system substrate-binding protein
MKGIFVKMKHLAPSAAILAVGALTLSACGGASATGEEASGGDSDLQGTLTGIGASSQKAAMDAWTADFTSQNSGVTVNYSPDGSGAGREQFLAGNAQFAGSDAHLDDDEVKAGKEACGADGAYEFPVYISPIAVTFNVEGVDELNLSPETIAKIFKGDITKWNDEAIKKPTTRTPISRISKITAVHRADDSGTTENFAEYLKATAEKDWDAEVDGNFPKEYGGEAAQGTDGIIQTVSDTEGAIGYADASAVGELSTAKVKVGDEFVELSPEAASKVVDASEKVEGRSEGDLAFDLARDTTESGAYPIVLVSYHLVCSSYKDQETVDMVKAWEKFVVSEEGQKSAADSAGSAPLSDDLRKQIEEVIDSIKVEG